MMASVSQNLGIQISVKKKEGVGWRMFMARLHRCRQMAGLGIPVTVCFCGERIVTVSILTETGVLSRSSVRYIQCHVSQIPLLGVHLSHRPVSMVQRAVGLAMSMVSRVRSWLRSDCVSRTKRVFVNGRLQNWSVEMIDSRFLIVESRKRTLLSVVRWKKQKCETCLGVVVLSDAKQVFIGQEVTVL